MASCWQVMCAQDCTYCRYKQDRYQKGHATPCYQWFAQRHIAKSCKTCRFYLDEKSKKTSLPEDPSWHPEAA